MTAELFTAEEHGAEITAPLPDTRMNRTMRAGHRARTGHELDAHLAYDGGGIWHIVRHCCSN